MGRAGKPQIVAFSIDAKAASACEKVCQRPAEMASVSPTNNAMTATNAQAMGVLGTV
jgi:hypothetical protein